MIEFILDSKTKKIICKQILENLNEWFEDSSARENYIQTCATLPFWCYKLNEEVAGFICLKPTSPVAMELYVMGVKKDKQRQKIGEKLFTAALNFSKQNNYKFMHVKTVKFGVYPEYDITNNFYKKVGFEPLEVIEDLWDENNPCQLYILSI